MKDKIINAVAMDGTVRIIAGTTTNLVEKVREIHECTPVAAAALGRMITAGALLGTTLKSDKEIMTLRINGGGEAEGITVTAHENAVVKGFIGNPYGDRPLNEKGKLDVGGYVGKNGNLIIIKDLGMKDPYVGQVPIFSGEIAEDFANYFVNSEQRESAIALGVLVDKNGVKSSGGYLIQLMPGSTEEEISKIEQAVFKAGAISKMLDEELTLTQIAKKITGDENIQIVDESITPIYECDCSKEHMKDALATIGKEELKDIIEKEGKAELVCHFCNKKYEFSKEELEQIIKE